MFSIHPDKGNLCVEIQEVQNAYLVNSFHVGSGKTLTTSYKTWGDALKHVENVYSHRKEKAFDK